MPKTGRSPSQLVFLGKLIAARKASGLTQKDLADRLQKTQGFVSSIETGLRRVDVIEFCAIAHAIGIEPIKLFGEIAADLPLAIEI